MKTIEDVKRLVAVLTDEQQQLLKDTINKGGWGDGMVSYNLFDVDGKYPSIEELAFNDGLNLDDWKAWFQDYDFTKPMAVIHFTKFRY